MPATGPFFDQDRDGTLFTMCAHVKDGAPVTVAMRLGTEPDRNGLSLADARIVELCHACANEAGVDPVPTAPPSAYSIGTARPAKD